MNDKITSLATLYAMEFDLPAKTVLDFCTLLADQNNKHGFERIGILNHQSAHDLRKALRRDDRAFNIHMSRMNKRLKEAELV